MLSLDGRVSPNLTTALDHSSYGLEPTMTENDRRTALHPDRRDRRRMGRHRARTVPRVPRLPRPPRPRRRVRRLLAGRSRARCRRGSQDAVAQLAARRPSTTSTTSPRSTSRASCSSSIEKHEAGFDQRDLNVIAIPAQGSARSSTSCRPRPRTTGRTSPTRLHNLPAAMDGYIETLRSGIAQRQRSRDPPGARDRHPGQQAGR